MSYYPDGYSEWLLFGAPPFTGCTYVIKEGDVVVYAGQTEKFERRKIYHKTNGFLTQNRVMEVVDTISSNSAVDLFERMNVAERALIAQHQDTISNVEEGGYPIELRINYAVDSLHGFQNFVQQLDEYKAVNGHANPPKRDEELGVVCDHVRHADYFRASSIHWRRDVLEIMGFVFDFNLKAYQDYVAYCMAHAPDFNVARKIPKHGEACKHIRTEGNFLKGKPDRILRFHAAGFKLHCRNARVNAARWEELLETSTLPHWPQ